MSDEGGEDLASVSTIGRYRDRIVSGPIIRTLIWLGAPPFLNQLIVVAYNVADAYWLSLYSEYTVAVPRQVWPIIMLFQALLNALNAASLSMISQYVGGKRYKEASLSSSRFFTISAISGGTLCASLLALRKFIFLYIMFTPPEIFSYVMDYSGVIALDIFLNYISLTFTTILQSVGDTRRPAIVNAASVSLNILLDPFLVLGLGPFPRLGVIGASATDVMGKAISMCALAYVIKRHYPSIKVSFTKNIDLNWIILVLRIGLPIFILGATNSFAFLMQLGIVNLLGIVTATAYAIGFIVMDIVDAALWGLSGATAIMVGQSLGAGNIKRTRGSAYKSALLIFALVALGACITYPFRATLADVFADDPAVISETDLFLQTLLPTLPFFGLFSVAMSAGRGSGHTLTPALIGIIRLWGIRVGLGYLLAFIAGMGSLGAWFAIALSNIIGGIASLIWIKYGGWAKPIVREQKQ